MYDNNGTDRHDWKYEELVELLKKERTRMVECFKDTIVSYANKMTPEYSEDFASDLIYACERGDGVDATKEEEYKAWQDFLNDPINKGCKGKLRDISIYFTDIPVITKLLQILGEE